MTTIMESLEGINTVALEDMKSIEELSQKLNEVQGHSVLSFAKLDLHTEYIPSDHIFRIYILNNHAFLKGLQMDFLLPAKADLNTEPTDKRKLTEIFDNPIPYMRAVMYGTGGEIFAEYTTRVVNLKSLFKVIVSTAVKMGSDYAQAFMDNMMMQRQGSRRN